jgi:hypothetical protein
MYYFCGKKLKGYGSVAYYCRSGADYYWSGDLLE